MPNSAPAPKLRIDLNLLHPRQSPTRLPERFLKWLITYGRFIVIFVEIIVVGAFLARFKLDADLDDLKRRINLDLPYIQGLSTDEALINQTQTKLALIDKTYLNSDKWQAVVLEISSQIPQSIQFLTFNMDQKDDATVNFTINANTISNNDLGIFLNNLKNQENLREIGLSSISFEDEKIVFSITGSTLKQ